MTPMTTSARAWRERLRTDRLQITRRRYGNSTSSTPFDAPHCADLFVSSVGVLDPATFSARLGELLRLVDLATAPHVDPRVLNALFNDDALCAMGPTPCTRCDAADPDAAPAVALSIARGCRERRGERFERLLEWRSGVGIVHDALYAWDEASASAEFQSLRDALGTSARDRPPLQLTLVLGLFEEFEEDVGMEIRDLQALAARAGTGRFRLTGVVPLGRKSDATWSHYAQLHTAILDLGICARLAPRLRQPATPEETQHMWQWLIDWVKRANAPPPVEALTIVWYPGQTSDVLIQLLHLVVANNRTLRQLTLFWPLRGEDEMDQRAAEAIGAVLLAPHASVCLERLELEVGELSADLVAALQAGAQGSSDSSAGGSDAVPRFRSIKWKAPHTSEAHIGQVVELFGAVGVCELEVNVGGRDLSCHTLKGVLQDCAATLTSLTWRVLSCDDVLELEDATTWSKLPRQLRGLSIYARDAGDPNMLRAVDALLARVGGQLRHFHLCPLRGALDAVVAETIVTRCSRLQSLGVANASPAFYQRLTAAYNDGTCSIAKLWAQGIPRLPDIEWSCLLEALRDATSGATRNVRELILSTIWEPNGAFNTLIEILSTNTTLTRVWLNGSIGVEAEKRLQALPRRFAVRPPSLRRRLALISVGHSRGENKRLSKLPRDVLEVVFAFAGRRVLRVEYS